MGRKLLTDQREKHNVYAKTLEECETLLAEMIERVRAEIAAQKAQQKTGG